MSNSNKIEFRLYDPFSDLDKVKEIWLSLINKCPHSYFLSWPWLEIWLKSLPRDCNVSLVAGFQNKTAALAFFLGSSEIKRHKFFKIRKLSLNETLIPHIDTATYIQYNSMLIDPDITINLESLLNSLPTKSWDELYLNRIAPIFQPGLIIGKNSSSKYETTIKRVSSYYIDLEKIREKNNNYLALLSQNRRKQIRRAIKEYERIGNIHIETAKNTNEAIEIFDSLIELHQQRWNDKGFPGVFSNKYAVDFHKTLISKRFDLGEIQLISVSAGDHIIGCQYNYIYDGNVYAILGGYNYLPENYYLPGFVCDYLTIEHNSKAGLSTYDLMGGEDIYKKSLSTDHNEIQDVLIQKKSLKLKLEKVILRLYRAYQKLTSSDQKLEV